VSVQALVRVEGGYLADERAGWLVLEDGELVVVMKKEWIVVVDVGDVEDELEAAAIRGHATVTGGYGEVVLGDFFAV